MKSSASLSAIRNSQPSAGPSRRSFALSGHSVAIDPKFNAVRRDLADIRLADRVFAPHYAAPLAMVLVAPQPLRLTRETESAVLTTLASGDVFEVLELAGGNAWGVAPGCGMVGYIDAGALIRSTTA